MYVCAGCPAFAQPYVGVHRSIYIYIYIYIHLKHFSSVFTGGFFVYWRQVSLGLQDPRTLVDFYRAVVWMTEIFPQVSSLFSTLIGIVQVHQLHSVLPSPSCSTTLSTVLHDPDVCLNFRFWDIGPAVRVFANGPGDLGSIPGRVIPKTLKMELDTTLLNTQHYKVRFKGKVEKFWEWSSALPYTLV